MKAPPVDGTRLGGGALYAGAGYPCGVGDR